MINNILYLKLIETANCQMILVTPLILHNRIVIVLKDVWDYQYFKAAILNSCIYSWIDILFGLTDQMKEGVSWMSTRLDLGN